MVSSIGTFSSGTPQKPIQASYYYLQSRYYDPGVGRFINADEPMIFQITQGQLLGANIMAYCGNNPVNNSDPYGNWGMPTPATIIAGALIGGILSALIDAVIQLTVGGKTFNTLNWASIGIEFAAGVLTGALIACNFPAPYTNLGRGIIGMMASLSHSFSQGNFSTLSGAFIAVGQAVLSGAITVIIGSVRAKYGKTLNYESVRQMITKIGINRVLRGGIRVTIGWGWSKLNMVLN